MVREDRVYLGLEATDPDGALRTVAERVSPAINVPADRIVSALQEREKLGSTSVGDGFAIPHCKLPGLRSIELCVARFADGVPFNSNDGQPVRFFFVVLSPPDQPAAHLQVLSQIARVLKRAEVRAELLEAENVADLNAELFAAAEAEGV